MESRDRIGEASGTRAIDGQSENKEEVQDESETNEAQAVTGALMEMLGTLARVESVAYSVTRREMRRRAGG